MSPVEQRLWHGVRRDQLGVSFRRQHAVGPYVLDFYCSAFKLAIELDGDDHAQRRERDEARTRFLNGQGIDVVRFSNLDVTGNLPGVLEAITMEISKRRT